MPRKPASPQPAPQPVPHILPQGQVRWLVDQMHVGTTPTAVVREIARRVKHQPQWTREIRRAVYRYALQCHAENQSLYRTVTGSI